MDLDFELCDLSFDIYYYPFPFDKTPPINLMEEAMFTENNAKKVFDLEERTFRFAQNVRIFLKSPASHAVFLEDKKQLTRSAGSIAANYVEANESISPKDFVLRTKICRKEAKESYLWLRLISNETDQNNRLAVDALIQESLELAKIFGAIVYKFREK